MTQKKAQKTFEKYNPESGIVRCPHGRAKMRKPLDLYVKAATNLYGIIKRDEFVEIFNNQNEDQTNVDEIYIILLPLVIKSKLYCFYKDYIVHNGIFHDFDIVEMLEEYQSGKPRYIPEKEDFLKYQQEDHKYNNNWLKVFFFLADNFGISKEVHEAFEEIKINLVYDNDMDILEEIFEKHSLKFEDIDQVQEFFELVTYANNNTRIWENKGYTPNEMFNLIGHKILQDEIENIDDSIDETENIIEPKLKEFEANLFYDTWYKLMDYVNNKLEIVDCKIGFARYNEDDKDNLVYKVREELWKDSSIIVEFIESDGNKLTQEQIDLLESWEKNHIKSGFVLYKYTPYDAIFMSIEQDNNSKLYAVKGIVSSVSEIMNRNLPCMLETVLLPFKDFIIYDTFIMTQNIRFGRSFENMINEGYAKAEKKYGIFTKL